jgi:glycerophosphoryl diester phosphodiesterase
MAVTPGSPERAGPASVSDRRARPLVFAHRGSSAVAPEHTLDAYLRAIDEGADGLECDVRLTRDGHLVCVHDRRLERTSNGRGPVSMYTLAQLSDLDFGSWHPVSRPVAGILTLDRLIMAARQAGRPIQLLIETKHPSRGGTVVEERVAELLRRHGLHRPRPGAPVSATVMSFSPLAVRRIRRIAPVLPAVMLMEYVPPGLRTGRLPFGANIGGPKLALVRNRPDIIRRLHARGNRVYVWTVNEPADVDLMVQLGVDGLITDRPGDVLHRLDAWGLPHRRG